MISDILHRLWRDFAESFKSHPEWFDDSVDAPFIAGVTQTPAEAPPVVAAMIKAEEGKDEK